MAKTMIPLKSLTLSSQYVCVSYPNCNQLPLHPTKTMISPSSSLSKIRSLNLNKQSRSSLFANASSVIDFTPEIADVLCEVSIFTASGESIMFKHLWDQTEGIAVVALLRHFGCFCCWEFASALKESKVRFDGAGVKLIAVGVGTPNRARLLTERLPFPSECLYADPERKAYDVLGLYYGLGQTLFSQASAKVFSRSDSLKKAIKATTDDKRSVLQQGGMFVFMGKELLYAPKEEGAVDYAPLDDVFDICCKAPVA